MPGFFPLLLCVLLASCASFGDTLAPQEDFPGKPASGDSGFWDTRPENGRLVFIGGAALRENRDEALRFALLDAARKVSIFHGVRGLSVSAVSVGEGPYDFYADAAVEIAFNPEYERYVEELDFNPQTDVLEAEGSVFVRARWTPPLPFGVDFSSGGKGRPGWVTSPPETIGGFIAGVGRSNAFSRRHDTLIASYENAIGAILNAVNSHVRSGMASLESSGFAASVSSNVQIAAGELRQFYILEIWADPKTGAVWTLGIAKAAGE